MVRHRVLVGVDASRWGADTKGVDFLGDDGPIRIDIRESKVAFLLQDQMSAGGLRLRLAVQKASTPTHEESSRDIVTGAPLQTFQYLPARGTNWDVGLLHQLPRGFAVYAGAQRSNEANLVLPGQNVAGQPIPPTATVQGQAGIKLGRERLYASVELFSIRQSTFKLFNLGDVVLPGRTSRGLEFEVTGRPHPRVDLNLGLSMLDAVDQVPAGGGQTVASAANQIPRRSGHLLSIVRLGDLLGEDNRLGIAFHAASSTRIGHPYFGSLPFALPGGGQLDLSWYGSLGAWTLKGVVSNVFDQRLFGPSADSRFIPLQPGRSISLTASYME